MIPHRIRLSGFLSYKDEQTVRFDGSPLWMLSGTNGSGKSSIFDAVTYALFGHHRGGSIQAVELVNKESTTLAVDFDFMLDGCLYRIKRTLKKLASGNKTTFQILKRTDPLPAPDGRWEPVEDTQLKAGFDAWIRNHIGLNYETFTSSVLLLQGKAEKLLDSTPSGRAGVLASIVDLERYQKLHGKADDRRRELKGKLDALGSQLAAVRDVTDDEHALAAAKIEEAEAARAAAHGRVDASISLEMQARQWSETVARLAATREKLRVAEGLLGHAVAIEKEFARLRELKDVLPTAGTIVSERGRAAESERKTERFTADREDKADRRRQVEHAVVTSRQKLTALKKTLGEDEAKQGTLYKKLQELAAVLEKVRLVEDQQAELSRLDDELKRLPADPEAKVRELQEREEHLSLLAQALPSLDRLASERSDLIQAYHREGTAKADEAKLLADGKRAKAEFEATTAALGAARQAREQADAATAEARAHHRQAKAAADEFATHAGEKSCRACGQALTPQHFDKEKKARDAALRLAEKVLHDTTAASAKARDNEASQVQREADGRRSLEELRDRYKERAGEVKQVAADIRRLTGSVRETYLALPEAYKVRVGPVVPDDWTAVAFPARDELIGFRREATGVDAVRRQLREARDATSRWQGLHAKRESARDRLAKVAAGMPKGDPATLRQDYAARQAEEAALTNALKGTKREIQQVETEVDRLQRTLGECDRDLVALAGHLQNEENTRKQSQETIDRLKRALPPAWQTTLETAGLREQLQWKEEFEGLAAKGVEAKHSQLQQARGGLDSLRAEISGLEADAAAFPPDARRPPEEARALVAAARKELDARGREHLEAKQALAVLDGYRKQRHDLGGRLKALDADHARHDLLSKLLGRDRLQRHLVRQAERQIVDYANGVLDRLSGGQLFLKLVGTDDGAADKALDLEAYNRVTGGAPINVAFLSGSQRFRVAVSLALGIGQYASKQHRPIESVIIDEGFGCLDRAGRQVMIQELQNLRGHLHCILLVSHQEEFADAFPDGYRFELQDGATRVSRFER